MTLRESCFECRFTSPEREGDITLGDFWNIKAERFVQRSIENGVNLVLLNTERGKKLFNSIRPQLYIEERTWDDAHKSNKSLSSAWNKPNKYDIFWADYIKNGLEYTIEKYCKPDAMEAEEKLNIKLATKRVHQYFIPLWLRKSVHMGKCFVKGIIYAKDK